MKFLTQIIVSYIFFNIDIVYDIPKQAFAVLG